jgi:hypothetical protein
VSLLFYILGSCFVVLGLVDVFFTVLTYDSASVVVEPGCRVAWRAIGACARHLPTSAGSFLRSIGPP